MNYPRLRWSTSLGWSKFKVTGQLTGHEIQKSGPNNLDIVPEYVARIEIGWKLAEEIDYENDTFHNVEGHLTSTLTSDQGQGHIVVHHSSSTTQTPSFIQIEQTLCGRTDIETGFSANT